MSLLSEAMDRLFGLEIKRKSQEKEDAKKKSFVAPDNDDGAVVVAGGPTSTAYGTYIDLDGTVRSEIELITRYREMALQPELEQAIEDIVNEAIVIEDTGQSIELNTDELELPDQIKDKIREEFEYILKLMNFSQIGPDVFRRWYVDGRLFYHIITDEKNPKAGILELRYIDPRRIRKVREVERGKDENTGITIIKKIREYYLYNEKGILGINQNVGAKISKDSVASVTSGLMDPRRAMVISYLHKAIKPLNQLRMVEDAMVIYRLSRAPERRVFYVDTGDLVGIKAEQYLKDIMIKHRNKIVYDASSGEVRDDRKFMAMTEDYWIPRREGSTGTQIDTLPGGQNLGQIEDVEYFQKRLYKALGIPVSRLEDGIGFNIGRASEITRDELKFNKFIKKLRNQFSTLFDDLLRMQCVLKGICTDEEWDEIKESIWYDFLKDNYIDELKEKEITNERLVMLQAIDPYVGRYYSMEWIKKNILRMDEEEIEEIRKQIDKEGKNNELPGFDMYGNAVVAGTGGGQPEPPPPPEDEDAGPNKSADSGTKKEETESKLFDEFLKTLISEEKELDD